MRAGPPRRSARHDLRLRSRSADQPPPEARRGRELAGGLAQTCPGSVRPSARGLPSCHLSPRFPRTAPFSFLPVRPAAPASCTGGTWGTRARLGREGMERAHGARGAGWARRPLPRRSRDPGGDEPGRLLHWATDAQVTESSAGSVEAQSCGFRSVGVHRCAQVMQVCSGVLVSVPVCSRDSHGSGVFRCAARRCKVSSSPGRGRDKGPFWALRRSRRPETGHRQGPSALPGKLEKRCTPRCQRVPAAGSPRRRSGRV